MLVETIGSTGRLSDLQPGHCFFFHDGKQAIFAIHTIDEESRHSASIVFSREGGDRIPWAAIGGLPHTILVTRPLKIRTDPTSLTFGNSLPLGHVISAGGRFYLAASLRKIDVVTINLSSGMTEELPNIGPIVSFPGGAPALSMAIGGHPFSNSHSLIDRRRPDRR